MVDVFDPVGRFVGYLVLCLLFLGGLGYARQGVGVFRDVHAMLVTRTAPAAEAGEGRTEVSGRVRPVEEPLTDPVTGVDAVAYSYRVADEKRAKTNLFDWTRWGYRVAEDGEVAVPFYVEDESGRVRVDPGDPDGRPAGADGVVRLYAPDDAVVSLAREEPASAEALDEWVDPPERADGQNRRVRTAPVEVGDPVYVLGTVRFDGVERVVEGGDGRFVVAGASQARTLVATTARGLATFVGGLLLALVSGASAGTGPGRGVWRVAAVRD